MKARSSRYPWSSSFSCQTPARVERSSLSFALPRWAKPGFDGRELTLERDAPGFAQRVAARLSDDGSNLAGVWQLNEDDQGYRDDLAFTYRRARSG